MYFNDRRTIKNPAVAAAAKAGSIKAKQKDFKIKSGCNRL